ncbi:MAG: HAMP domain-containing histidine kinase [Acidobacteria bacterium]|nr:HAMP domain-containing histidine kinase [Acidobacteriota bacterium]
MRSPRSAEPVHGGAESPRRSFNLLRYFTGASLAILLGIFVGFSASSAWLVHEAFVSVAKDQADSIVEDIVSLCHEQGYPRSAWHSPPPEPLREAILAEMQNFNLSDVRLLALDGTLLQRFSLPGAPPFGEWREGILEARAGRVALRRVTPASWRVALLGLGSLAGSEFATPVREEGRVVAVAAVRREFTSALGLAQRVVPWLVVLAALAALAAFAALYLLVRRADQLIRSQAAAIECARRELERRNAELVALHRRKDEVLAVCSHDLRSPLLAVHAGCRLLLHDTPENGAAAEILHENLRSAETVIHLVDSLLDLARIEAGVDAPRLEPVDLAALAQEAASGARRYAASRDVALALEERSGRPPVVAADRMMLLRVVNNLLSNAIKHAPPGSVVTLATRREEGAIALAVSDRGPGIGPEQATRLFERFSPLARDRRTREEGTGLGLSIARQLVELHGGTIHVHSVPGQGATFEVLLPA